MSEITLLIQQKFSMKMLIAKHHSVNNPEISIIIPTYNCLKYLPLCIKSIQKQLVESIEILIIDDGSTDDTWQYLALAAQCDKRIKPIRIPQGGVAKARNYGLKIAKGQYIAFLDADDYWLSKKLIKQLHFHKYHPTVTLSFCNYLHFNEKNQDLGDCFNYWPHFKKHIRKQNYNYNSKGYVELNIHSTATIFAENVIGTSSVMLNKKALNKQVYFDETLVSAEDWDFWLKASLLGPIGFTNSIDVAYLMRPNSETSNNINRLTYMQKIMCRYTKDVFKIRPLAFLACLSRLLTAYAEYYRISKIEKYDRPFNLNHNLKACLYHFMAFSISPSKRLLKATLFDMKTFIFKLFAESIAKCK